MQSCNNMNWWLMDDRSDPGDQLKWLEQELASLEIAGGFAHIMAHIPPNECLHQFGERYHALMDRYQNVVRYSSFGHTHQEDFLVTRAMNTVTPIGFNLITGSGTTMTNVNPGFTVIDFDEEFMVPVNIHTYYMDVNESNKNPSKQPDWKLLHDYIEEYSMVDLSPSSFRDLTNRLYNSLDLAQKYENNRYKLGISPEAKYHDDKYIC